MKICTPQIIAIHYFLCKCDYVIIAVESVKNNCLAHEKRSGTNIMKVIAATGGMSHETDSKESKKKTDPGNSLLAGHQTQTGGVLRSLRR